MGEDFQSNRIWADALVAPCHSVSLLINLLADLLKVRVDFVLSVQELSPLLQVQCSCNGV
jgi:hypothetical protein